MTTIVVGASGATGKQLVMQLLEAGQQVRAIVRPTSTVPASWHQDDRVQIIKAEITQMGVGEMALHLEGCEGVACCLGHNLTWKGIYGKPRLLVTETVQLLCDAISTNALPYPVKLVLMNTAGNSHRGLSEKVSLGQKIVTGIIRLLLPPHADNEKAADYLRMVIGQKDPAIEWVVVRPDSLIDQEQVTGYSIYPSPTRSAIFNPGKTSRIHVGHFMARLLTDESTWNSWKGQMPVIYNDIAPLSYS
jgi:hypothetical protein